MLAEILQNKLALLVESARTSLNNVQRVALFEAWKLLDEAIATVVITLQDFATNLSGPEKKAEAMSVISEFYDKVFTIVEFPFIPKILQPVVQSYVKKILMILVSAGIDSTVKILKAKGVLRPSNPTVEPTIDPEDVTPVVSDK